MIGRANLIAITLLAMSSPALAQDDDWDLSRDPDGQWVAAQTVYASGHGIRVQCVNGYVETLLLGMDRLRGDHQIIERVSASGDIEAAVWRPERDRTLRSSPAGARYARLFAASSSVVLRLVERDGSRRVLTFEMPSEHTNVDAVLNACEEPLSEGDDARQDVWELIVDRPAVEMPVSVLNGHDQIAITVRCTVSGDQLTACQSPNQTPSDPRAGERVARLHEGRRLRLIRPADGETVEVILSGQRFRR